MRPMLALSFVVLGSCSTSTEYVGTDLAGSKAVETWLGEGCQPGSRPKGAWRAIPSPTTADLSAIWGSSAQDIWVTSSRSTTVHHWDGTTWSSMTTPGTTNYGLNDVWGTGAGDVWAAGNNGIINHWNGAKWTASRAFGAVDHFYRVWGTGPSDVWASGAEGLMAHWGGTAWSRAAVIGFPDAGQGDGGRPFPPAIEALWSSSPQDVWAAGYQIFVHLDSDGWSTSMTTSTQLFGMWGSGSNDVWAVGTGGPTYVAGVMYHWDGIRWGEVAYPTPLYDVWGAGPKDVWAVGHGMGGATPALHWDGCTWNSVPTNTTRFLSAVWGSGSENVWAVGQEGAILRYSR